MICIPCNGKKPVLKSGSFTAPNVSIIGNVVLEEGASVWYNSVARCEFGYIHIGKNAAVEDSVVIHANEKYPVTLKENAVIGHGAILHGCSVGKNCVIGMGSILMNGCVIGDNCLVAAGSLVTQGVVIPEGSMVMGSPAKVKRPLTEEELESIRGTHKEYLKFSEMQLTKTP